MGEHPESACAAGWRTVVDFTTRRECLGSISTIYTGWTLHVIMALASAIALTKRFLSAVNGRKKTQNNKITAWRVRVEEALVGLMPRATLWGVLANVGYVVVGVIKMSSLDELFGSKTYPASTIALTVTMLIFWVFRGTFYCKMKAILYVRCLLPHSFFIVLLRSPSSAFFF